MKRRGLSKKRGFANYLDLTPVVDVVFNLLIFFALSLNFTPAVKGIQIKVPEVSSQVDKVQSKKVNVSIYANGRIFLNERQVSKKLLRETLESLPDKSAVVVIKAEENVAHGTVVDIVASIKSAGYKKLALAAKTLSSF
ncbi:MAG: ExbD/TolR family protein [Thermodesulfobacteriota bacterium]